MVKVGVKTQFVKLIFRNDGFKLGRCIFFQKWLFWVLMLDFEVWNTLPPIESKRQKAHGPSRSESSARGSATGWLFCAKGRVGVSDGGHDGYGGPGGPTWRVLNGMIVRILRNKVPLSWRNPRYSKLFESGKNGLQFQGVFRILCK